MSTNPLQNLDGAGQTSLESLANQTNAPAFVEDADTSDSMLAVLQELVEALGVIGPHTMDDSNKYHAVRSIIAAMVLADGETELNHSATLPETEENELNPGVPHYHPLNELEELDEPTVNALGERYNVEEIIEYTASDDFILALQRHLASALLELNGTRFPQNYNAGCAILAAMLLVDDSFNGHTELELENVTETASLPGAEDDDGEEEFEYETQSISITIVRPEPADV